MRKLMNKKLNKKGFTLMEMLIVVAIIAILVAIAIPTFSKSLNAARASADAANIRAGYATLLTDLMLEDTTIKAPTTGTADYYLMKDGSVAAAKTDAYTCQTDSTNLKEKKSIGGITASWNKDQVIKYTVDTNGKITAIAGE